MRLIYFSFQFLFSLPQLLRGFPISAADFVRRVFRSVLSDLFSATLSPPCLLASRPLFSDFPSDGVVINGLLFVPLLVRSAGVPGVSVAGGRGPVPVSGWFSFVVGRSLLK